jgi:hypothetical protein
MSNLSEIKSYFRDIKMGFLMSKYDVKIDDSNLNDNFHFLKKNRKLIEYANSIGAVLTGSRALSSYKINGKSIIDRKLNDWDFIITKEMAFDICDMFNIEYNLVDKVININSSWISWHSGYSSVPNRIGIQDVQLIIEDELPSYLNSSKYRIADFSYIIGHKIKSIEKGKDKGKHRVDLNKIIVKLNSRVYENT